MKRIIITLLVGLFTVAGIAQTSNQKDSKTGPQISFDKKVHNYGEIERKSDGTCTFTLTNTGTEPLVLTNVRTSCGCTAANWPRKPIPAGESKKIKVNYDTRRMGNFSKSIKVYNNATNTPVELRIKGQVK